MTACYEPELDPATAAAWAVLAVAHVIGSIHSGELPVPPEDAEPMIAELARAMADATPEAVEAEATTLDALAWRHLAAVALGEHERPDANGIQPAFTALMLACRRDARRLGVHPDYMPLPGDADLADLGIAGTA